jgi:hypothetical protein
MFRCSHMPHVSMKRIRSQRTAVDGKLHHEGQDQSNFEGVSQ